MDKDLTNYTDIMSDATLRLVFETWVTPLAFAIAVWYIIAKLKEIVRHGARRDNAMKITEIKVDAIAYSLSNAPHPIGEHFKENYEKKIAERLRDEKFIDEHNRD